MGKPIPFPSPDPATGQISRRRPGARPAPSPPDRYAEILERLAALSDAVDEIEALVIEEAARAARPRG